MKGIFVSVELLERAVRIPTKASVEENHAAIVDRGRAQSELRALLSAPSPAGVDGLKRYEVFPYLDDEVAEIDICESDDGSFVKYEDAQAIIDGLRGEVAQFKATISDSESVFVNMMRGTIAKPSLRSMVNLYFGEVLNGEDALQLELAKANAERDQQAQRIGELEGLLRAESARVDFLDAYIVTADAPDTGKAAMLADSGTLRECIDAALSAGKDSDQ